VRVVSIQKSVQFLWLSCFDIYMRLQDLHPHLTHGSFRPLESPPKRHLNRFSHLCRAHKSDQQTKWTRYSVCSNRQISLDAMQTKDKLTILPDGFHEVQWWLLQQWDDVLIEWIHVLQQPLITAVVYFAGIVNQAEVRFVTEICWLLKLGVCWVLRKQLVNEWFIRGFREPAFLIDQCQQTCRLHPTITHSNSLFTSCMSLITGAVTQNYKLVLNICFQNFYNRKRGSISNKARSHLLVLHSIRAKFHLWYMEARHG